MGQKPLRHCENRRLKKQINTDELINKLQDNNTSFQPAAVTDSVQSCIHHITHHSTHEHLYCHKQIISTTVSVTVSPLMPTVAIRVQL